MSGHTYTFMIINTLEIIIMLLIRYVLKYRFVKKESYDKDKIEKAHYYTFIGYDLETPILCPKLPTLL
jgi:hypothetical protein